jgi:hypothetical protein
MRNNLKHLSEDYTLMSNIAFSQLLYTFFYGTASLYSLKDELDPEELPKVHGIIQDVILEDLKNFPQEHSLSYGLYVLWIVDQIRPHMKKGDRAQVITNKLQMLRETVLPAVA